MTNKITEATLEMHYHHAMMDLFRSTFGIGPTGQFSFFKYSTRKEKFVGFDQAYVQTSLSDNEFFSDISSIAQGHKSTPRYLGYFLQFKTVEERIKRLSYIPPIVSSVQPFYGVKLTTRRDATDDPSQHELLKNISMYGPQAMVYYACPLLFDKTDLYSKDADLDQIVLVEVNSRTPAFTDNKPHHIFFTSPTSTPVWCSEPIDGISTNLSSVFFNLMKTSADPKVSARFLADLFKDSDRIISTEKERAEGNSVQKKLADIFYLIRY